MAKNSTIGSSIRWGLARIGATWAAVSVPVFAQVPNALENGVQNSMPNGAPTNLLDIFQNVINTIIFIIGAIAVVMLIVGGVRYATSAGNPDRVKGAQNTILYAIIGIVVAVIAFAAVNFVINALGTGST